MLTRSNYSLLILLLLLLATEVGLRLGYAPERQLQGYARELEAYIRNSLDEIDIDLRTRHSLQRFSAPDMPAETGDRLSHLLWYRGDSLVAWTHPSTAPVPDIRKAAMLPADTVIEIDQVFFLKKEYVQQEDPSGLIATALIPLYYQEILTGVHTPAHFPEPLAFPEAVRFHKNRGIIPVAIDELNIGHLESTATYLPPLLVLAHTVLYAGILFILCLLLHQLARRFSQDRPWLGILFLISMLIPFRWMVLALWTGAPLPPDSFIREIFEIPVLNTSLGTLFVNVLLLLWLFLFTLRIYPRTEIRPAGAWFGALLNLLNYGMIILGLSLIIGSFRNIIEFSPIPFDFDNVINLNGLSLLAIFELLLLLFVLFLLSHRIVLASIQISPRPFARFGAFGTALLIMIPVLQRFWTELPIDQVLLWSVIWVVILDFYVKSQGAGLSWLILWLILFSGFAAFLTNTFSNEKDLNRRLQYARILAQPLDSMLYKQLENVQRQWKQQPTPIKTVRLLEAQCAKNTYLLQNYTWKIDSLQSADCQDLAPTLHQGTYDGELNLPGAGMCLQARFTARHQELSPSLASLELRAPYKGLSELDQYDYAIYRDERLTDSNAPFQFTNRLNPALPPETGRYRVRSVGEEHTELIYKDYSQQVILLRKQTGGLIKHLSLFSYLFGILFLLSPLLALLNHRFRFLPEEIPLTLSTDLPLSSKIQLGILAVILTSFIFIGWLTSWYFQKSAAVSQEKEAGQRIQLLLSEINDARLKSDTLPWVDAVRPLVQAAQQDIYLYDHGGRLVLASNTALVQNGLRASILPAKTFLALSLKGYQRVISNEFTGRLKHRVIYVPISKDEESISGFLGVPFFSEYRQTQSRTADFIATLVNVYVFLLIIAGAVAIGVANSITRPLQDLSQRLQVLKLGKNEPLEWSSNDELGTLIQAYNQMLLKLEESTHKLAQSERESAWREMAKQVAHEIKNPLTPMKLSIQYLQHAYRSQPDRVEALIQQVSGTLVEQIDALSKIASEFSAFAKMPQAQFSTFSVNDLLQSVHGLFSQESAEIEFSLNLPATNYQVHFDKDQLLRVFNNIYKNAIQAIPEGRAGKIHSRLHEQNGQIIIQITDNGTGIPEAMQEKVFVPNFTTKSSGTGLGLAMAKNIIESAGGRIYFETKQDLGTSFFVELKR